jgi:hypothetical protein
MTAIDLPPMQASAFFNLGAVKAQIDEAINNDAGQERELRLSTMCPRRLPSSGLALMDERYGTLLASGSLFCCFGLQQSDNWWTHVRPALTRLAAPHS